MWGPVVASIPGRLGANRVRGCAVVPGQPNHLVHELKAATVVVQVIYSVETKEIIQGWK